MRKKQDSPKKRQASLLMGHINKSAKRKKPSIADLIQRIENVEKRTDSHHIYIRFIGKIVYYLSNVVSMLGQIVENKGKGNAARNSDEAWELHDLVEANLGRMKRGEDLKVPAETVYNHSFVSETRRV
jgi:hypothetical protein